MFSHSAKHPTELQQFAHGPIDLNNAGIQHLRDPLAGDGADALQVEDALDLAQGHAEHLGPMNEPQHGKVALPEQPVACLSAFNVRNKLLRFPEPNRLGTDANRVSCFSNGHPTHHQSLSCVHLSLTFPSGQGFTISRAKCRSWDTVCPDAAAASGWRGEMIGMVIRRLAQVGRSYTEVARSPSYFPLWLSQLVSSFGDTLHYIALVLLVYQLTGQGVAVAILVAAEVVPVLVLGPFAGVVIDRFSRKSVLITADLVRAGLVLSLLSPQGVWHAYAVAAGLAAGNTFFNPTVQAVIPVLTTEKQRLAANSVAWSTGRLVQILSSAIAGGLIALIGTDAAFGVNAATFVISALLLVRLDIPAHAGQLSAQARQGLGGFFRDAQDGLRFALHDHFVSRILLVQSLASFAVGATGAMLVVLSERHLGLPPSGFAWLIGAIGVGALLGPLIPNALATDYRDARWLFLPYVIRGVGDVLLAIFTPLPIALLILFVYGLNTSTGMVVFSSTVQGAVPDRVRGRVFTLLDVSWNAMRLLSLALGALVVDWLGVQPLFWTGGILLALAGVLGLVLLGRYDFRQPACPPSAL